jgi:hypothetical protein
VALLVMGTFAVGGGAYAMMERQSCQPSPPAAAAPAQPQTACTSRGSSFGGVSHSARYSFFGGGSSGGAAGSDSASGGVSRGGFGALASAFGFGRS